MNSSHQGWSKELCQGHPGGAQNPNIELTVNVREE